VSGKAFGRMIQTAANSGLTVVERPKMVLSKAVLLGKHS
jgi:hypothetical protein